MERLENNRISPFPNARDRAVRSHDMVTVFPKALWNRETVGGLMGKDAKSRIVGCGLTAFSK